MPKTITDEYGNEVEVYTAEELEAQKQEAIEQYKIANPDKSGDMEKLQADLAKAQEDLKGYENKDLNFANLRKQKEEAEQRENALREEIDKKIKSAQETVKKEVLEGVMIDHYNDTLNNLTGGDAELKKKVELQYGRLTDPASTKQEVSKKLTDAYLLATGAPAADISSTADAFSSGGAGGRFGGAKNNKNFSNEEKDLAKKLAQAGGLQLEDKDFNN